MVRVYVKKNVIYPLIPFRQSPIVRLLFHTRHHLVTPYLYIIVFMTHQRHDSVTDALEISFRLFAYQEVIFLFFPLKN